jgi:hypothetical protein
MENASKLLEYMTVSQPQLPAAYRMFSLNPRVVDGMINPVPPSVSPVDQVVNLVTSFIEPVDQVVNLIPSSVDPTLLLESENQVVNPFPCVDPILLLENATQVVDPISSSVDPTLPLESETQVVDLFPLVDPILPLENETQVVDLISPSVYPTLPLESKPNTSHVFFVDTESTMPVGTPPSLVGPPSSNEAICFNWGVLTGPHLPSYIPFHITVQVCGREVPQTLMDECSSISIFSSIAWKFLGCPPLASVTQNLLTFKRRTSQPLGTLPQFPVTLGGKTIFIDVMVVQDPLDFTLLLGRDYVYAMKVCLLFFI